MRFCICNLNGTTIKKGTNINSEEIINICEGLNKSGHFCEVLNYSKVQEGFNNISIYLLVFKILSGLVKSIFKKKVIQN